MRVSSSAPALSLIPANWAKRSEFEYDVPNHGSLSTAEQKEFWARYLLHQLVERLNCRKPFLIDRAYFLSYLRELDLELRLRTQRSGNSSRLRRAVKPR